MSNAEQHPLMTCGHAANARCSKSKGVAHDPPIPSCAICSCTEISDGTPDLTGRKALCGMCGSSGVRDSSLRLAFFEFLPDREYDRHYCGCRGWD